MAFNIDNIGGDALMGLDLGIEYVSYDADSGGDDGTLTSITVLATLLISSICSVSNSVTDDLWAEREW